MRLVNDSQYAAVVALSGPDRYSHFVRHVADVEEVWSLRTAEGWVLASAENGRQLVPVWPHPRYAAACATGNWQGAEPAQIPLDRWLEAWTSGMQRDGRDVTVFPTPSGQGVVVPPQRLHDDLLKECSQYE